MTGGGASSIGIGVKSGSAFAARRGPAKSAHRAQVKLSHPFRAAWKRQASYLSQLCLCSSTLE